MSVKAVQIKVNGSNVKFPIEKVKEYRRSQESASEQGPTSNEKEEDIDPDELDEQVPRMAITDEIDKLMSDYASRPTKDAAETSESPDVSIFVTKVVQRDDPFYTSKIFEDVRVAEVQGLISRGVFQVFN